MKNLLYIFCTLAVAVMSACSEQMAETEQNRNGLTIYTRSGSGNADSRENMFVADAFLFSGGKMKGMKNDVELSFGESVLISGLNYAYGDRLYFFSSETDLNWSGNSEDDFQRIRGPENKDGKVPVFYTGQVMINSNKEELVFRRGVARVDIHLQGSGLSVKSVSLSNVSPVGYVFEQEDGSVPDVQPTELKQDLSDVSPVSGKYYDNVFSLYEQNREEGIPISVTVFYNDEEKTVTGMLPGRLERNKIYTVLLSAKDVVIVGVDVKEWEVGGDIEMSPNMKDKIVADVENTRLSEGALLNEEGTVLTLPYWGGEQEVAFKSDSDLEFELEGELKDQIRVEPVAVSEEGFSLRNRFRITSDYRDQSQVTGTVRMKVKHKGAESYVNYLDVVLPENACRFYKDMDFTEKMAFKGNVCDYAKYVDGTLGYLQIPENYEISVTNSNWIRLDRIDGSNIYSIEGGYKPNDPDADGRVQDAQIVVAYNTSDGEKRTETFSLQRRNWGLPVVEINGVYWCKYNLRGNSTSFSDQIPYCYEGKKDPVENLSSFLTECGKKGEIYYPSWDYSYPAIVPASKESSVLFYTMLGDGYLGRNTNGMKYKPTSGINHMTGLLYNDYSYWGYTDQLWPENDTNLQDPYSMTPDGYRIPAPEDFRTMFNANSVSFGKATESGDFGDVDNPDFFKRINRREAVVQGKTLVYELIVIPPMGFTDIGSTKDSYFAYLISEQGKEDNPLVLMGHPSQDKVKLASSTWYTKDVTAFVTYNTSKLVWRLNGYDRKNVLLQQASYSEIEKLVKMIRCIKTPVKYIIE